MKKSILSVTFSIILLFFVISTTDAHFGMVIPSDNMVMQNEHRVVNLNLSFSHPFEIIGMPLVKPKAFFVTSNSTKTSLKNQLKSKTIMGHKAWELAYRIKMPGTYSFCMEPEPYWEPSEDCFIIHYTKTMVAAFGDDEGWDNEIGLKTEIIPLSKPFGLYTGNVFQGIAKLNAKPIPWATIEVEYYNINKKATAPTDYMITQTIKADQNGVFTYAAPKDGWWGFAALSPGDFKLNHNGIPKDVELGAVLWVKFEKWNE